MSIESLFVLYLFLVCSGINNFLSNKLAIHALLSPLILAMSFYFIYIGYRKGLRHLFISRYVKGFYWAFFSFFVIGGLIGFTTTGFGTVIHAFRFYLPSLLILWSGIAGFGYLYLKNGFRSILLSLRAALALNVLVILFAYFTGSNYFDVSKSSTAGFLLNPNHAGFSLNILLSIEIYLYSRFSNRYAIFIIVAILLSILIGFSRSALGAAFVIIMLTAFYNFRKIQKANALQKVFGVTFLAAFVWVFSADLISGIIEEKAEKVIQVERLIQGEIDESTTGVRNILFKEGFNRIMEHPIFGSGLHSFSVFDEIGSGVHNQYLLIWGEAGIIGILTFLIYYIFLGHHTLNLPRDEKVLIMSIVTAIMVYSFTNHTMYANKNYLMITAFIVILFEIRDSLLVKNIRSQQEYSLTE